MNNKRLGCLVYFFVFVVAFAGRTLKGADYTPPNSDSESCKNDAPVAKNKKCRHKTSEKGQSNSKYLGSVAPWAVAEEQLAVLKLLMGEQEENISRRLQKHGKVAKYYKPSK